MLAAIRHRGPETSAVFRDGPVALGHNRLSIIDLAGGLQPIANEDETVWIVVNGEVFNHFELREELRERGHRFRTASDSEVIVHLYEDIGPALLDRLNGQYAFALWDARRQELMLGRDRLGVRPLFYTVVDGDLLFASEVKALLVDPRVVRRPSLEALDQVFTYWSALPGQTMFEGINEVPAGHYARARCGETELTLTHYWTHSYPSDENDIDEEEWADRLRELLVDATRLRLRSDVPVGAYLSGGLDSSAIAAIVSRYTSNKLQTFSVAFENSEFDESRFQQRMVEHLGTDHHVVECTDADIARVFPDVIWHTETPLLRTAPAPLFLLSALVRDHGFKVVLTGEGADEFHAGYNVFKEALVRRFWAKEPGSSIRPLILSRLYDWIPGLQATSQSYLEAFFKQGLTATDDPTYSHALRWRNTSRLKRLFSEGVRETLAGYNNRRDLDALLNPALPDWHPLSQAQYLEIRTFLTPYLLSSQGDRMTMAHSVEGRFPFLDHRVVDLSGAIPPRLRMRGLNEKRVLKRAVADLLPEEIWRRPKQPYRAPISSAFSGSATPDYVADLLHPEAIERVGLFSVEAVSRLVAKARSTKLGENDNMALVGVLSTQLWHEQFIAGYHAPRMTDSQVIVMKRGETGGLQVMAPKPDSAHEFPAKRSA
jgi:asparagine synthase (glutamine-hydrolysing)